ncbi:methyl-accepting chemotaxis protein [Vibrio coralliilyticus]|uniref:methyl-accepting chemotaxis protein n=1 Tax=Vibrio coralliilyticus TaxID=190893 RepID=UPI00156089AB|nr:Cache 3/Cache 2 fusion domain-containing protein [Vibrio coralliilyticus]NRF32210.1 methyl-accepting chemotaxis protein [Vibrio coralliilyticus]NRF53295.1 methyl-accepting chemotaxis protein [Vibrio coralliilyticus]NRG03465.1 methyl-accepting chemotaxis protein [Vibrio coralliilyticus]
MLDWIKKQSIKTQLKLTLCGLLLVAITFIGNMTYHQVSAILINKGIQSTRTQLSALSTQLQHQYQTYQKKARRFNQILRSAYLPSIRSATAIRMLNGVQYQELTTEGERVTERFTQVDQFLQDTGVVATIFAATQDGDFIRITTSLMKSKYQRAYGTTLGKSHPAYENLRAGGEYSSRVSLFGQDYLSYYQAITEGDQVIGVSFVGIPLQQVQKELFSSLRAIVWGQTGYSMVVEGKSGERQGQFLLHPHYTSNDRITDIGATEDTSPFRQLFESTSGIVSYELASRAGDAQRKYTAYQYVEGWDWVIMGGTFESELAQESKTVIMQLLGVFGFGSFLMILSLNWCVARVFAPLLEITMLLHRLGQGQFNVSMAASSQETGKNEVRKLNEAARNMVWSVRAILSSNQQIASTSDVQISSLESSAARLKTDSHHAQEQLSQMVCAVEELSASSGAIADQVIKISEKAERARMQGQASQHSAHQTRDSLDKMANDQAELKDKIQALEVQAAQIEQVTGLIGEVAEQTNLLALNAAIEAARAGEAGRGFSVVSDEVRVLAAKTQTAIREISTMTEALGKRVHEVVNGMAKTSQQSERMHSTMIALEESVSEMGHLINDINTETAGIATTTEEQAQVSQSLASQAHHIDTLNQSAAQTADHLSNLTSEIQRSMHTLRGELNKFQL